MGMVTDMICRYVPVYKEACYAERDNDDSELYRRSYSGGCYVHEDIGMYLLFVYMRFCVRFTCEHYRREIIAVLRNGFIVTCKGFGNARLMAFEIENCCGDIVVMKAEVIGDMLRRCLGGDWQIGRVFRKRPDESNDRIEKKFVGGGKFSTCPPAVVVDDRDFRTVIMDRWDRVNVFGLCKLGDLKTVGFEFHVCAEDVLSCRNVLYCVLLNRVGVDSLINPFMIFCDR